jgi:hypothetical protein
MVLNAYLIPATHLTLSSFCLCGINDRLEGIFKQHINLCKEMHKSSISPSMVGTGGIHQTAENMCAEFGRRPVASFLYKQRSKSQSRRPYTKKSDQMLDRISNIETDNITSPTSGQNNHKQTYDTGENSKIQSTSHRRLKHTADGETFNRRST